MPYFDQFGAQDTSPEMMERFYELLHKKTPEERYMMVVSHMQTARRLAEIGKTVRGNNPGREPAS